MAVSIWRKISNHLPKFCAACKNQAPRSKNYWQVKNFHYWNNWASKCLDFLTLLFIEYFGIFSTCFFENVPHTFNFCSGLVKPISKCHKIWMFLSNIPFELVRSFFKSFFSLETCIIFLIKIFCKITFLVLILIFRVLGSIDEFWKPAKSWKQVLIFFINHVEEYKFQLGFQLFFCFWKRILNF